MGASRSEAYLIDSIRDPSKQLSVSAPDPNDFFGLPPPLDTVTVVTTAGEKVVGIARNEDPFSIQLMDMNQNFRFFVKAEVSEVIHERTSVMPAYTEATLDSAQLQDLVAYLDSLN